MSAHVHGSDEGAINPDIRLPACGRWRLPSPEEAAAGSHGLCRGMKHWSKVCENDCKLKVHKSTKRIIH